MKNGSRRVSKEDWWEMWGGKEKKGKKQMRLEKDIETGRVTS